VAKTPRQGQVWLLHTVGRSSGVWPWRDSAGRTVEVTEDWTVALRHIVGLEQASSAELTGAVAGSGRKEATAPAWAHSVFCLARRRHMGPHGVNQLRTGVGSTLRKGAARSLEGRPAGHREVTSMTRTAYSLKPPSVPAEPPLRPRGRKRANGEGSIYQRADGLWVAAITGADGHRRRVYAHTRADAGRRLTEALQRRDQGTGETVPAGRDTVAAYLGTWLDGLGGTVRATTAEKYRRDVRLHVLPYIGRLALPRLTPQRLQRLYGELAEAGLSAMSIRHIHAAVHKALEQAVRWGKVTRNVADLVDPPQASRAEMRTLTLEQVRTLLGAAREDRLEALYVVAVTTGMRRGELLGLRWVDVDIPGQALAVTGSLQRVKAKGLVRVEPKTARSRRRILLTPTAVAALRRHQEAQAAERLKAADWWQDQGLVFCSALGTPLEAGNMLRRSFHPLLVRAGLPSMRFHDLRHTAATVMLGRGVHPKIASEMLGHATVGITLDTYSHVTETMQRTAMEEIEAALVEG